MVWPSRKPTPSPRIEAVESSAIMAAISSAPAPATTPTVNNSESPGRKKPNSSPVSENTIAKSAAYPSHPESKVLKRCIRRSGSVSVRRNSSKLWIISGFGLRASSLAISRKAANQPFDHVIVILDLALLHQRLLQAFLEQFV